MDFSEQIVLCGQIAQAADRFNMRIGQLIDNVRSTYYANQDIFYLSDEELRLGLKRYVQEFGNV